MMLYKIAMDSYIFPFIAFIITVSILVTIHEFGHYWAARKCGVRVFCFSIGFGRPVFSWQGSQGTKFIIAIFPFGGYVKLADLGDEEAQMDGNLKTMAELSILRRIFIAGAGPAVNFIFAVFALFLMYMIGITTLVPIISAVTPNSLASQAGFTKDYAIKSINGHNMQSWQDVELFFLNHQKKDEKLEIDLENIQNSQKISKFLNLNDWDVSSKELGLIESIGFVPYKLRKGAITETMPIERADMVIPLFYTQRLNPFAALIHSVKETTILTKATFIVIGKIITGHIPLTTISGPIGIAQNAGQSAKMGLAYFCDYLALLSISLAVINLLPIPMLDGGLILYCLLEGLRGGNPISPNVREVGYKVGLLLIITIALVAFYNDLSKLIN